MSRRSRTLSESLGIDYPVIQAPMAGPAGPELATAVSAAGGLGSLGAAVLPAEEMLRQGRAVQERTERPFNVNFFCHAPPDIADLATPSPRDRLRPCYEELGIGEPANPVVPPFVFDDERLAAVLELRPAVVSFHFGLPEQEALEALKEAGCRLLCSATTLGEGIELAERGVDAVIAQGGEAGGHRGSFMVAGDDGPVGTIALVPQLADAVDVPVVAAGGIADGRGLAAALALGAAGAQIGTAFLRCPEAAVSPLYRAALRSASAEATTITRAFSGRPARALRNRATEIAGLDPLPFPAQLSLTAPLGAAAAERGSTDFLAMWCGQSAPLGRDLPAAELLAAIVIEADEILAELGGNPLGT